MLRFDFKHCLENGLHAFPYRIFGHLWYVQSPYGNEISLRCTNCQHSGKRLYSLIKNILFSVMLTDFQPQLLLYC
jgi:hypothetical protein